MVRVQDLKEPSSNLHFAPKPVGDLSNSCSLSFANLAGVLREQNGERTTTYTTLSSFRTGVKLTAWGLELAHPGLLCGRQATSAREETGGYRARGGRGQSHSDHGFNTVKHPCLQQSPRTASLQISWESLQLHLYLSTWPASPAVLSRMATGNSISTCVVQKSSVGAS